MKKLHILVSAYACNPLATEESYPGEALLGWNLINQLSRFHDVSVITRTYNRDGIDAEIKKGNISNLSFYYMTLPSFLSLLKKNFLGFSFYYLLWQIKAFFKAHRLHKRFKFNVFHHITFNNDWMPSFIGAYLPIPFIWGPMGGGQKAPSSLKRVMQLKSRINQNLRVIGQWFWRNSIFRRRCLKKALAVLVCNKDTKRKLKGSEYKIYSFPVNGISFDEFRHTLDIKNKESNKFHLIYAGRLDSIKGIGLGIKAFDIFHKKYPDSQFEIIGVGPEGSFLEKLVMDLGLEGKVFFIPWLQRKDLLKRMSESDLLLFPSFRDGGGAVIVEAMACGKPVIGINVGGPGFHIQKEWGIKIDPNSPEYVVQEMACAIEKLYLDKNLREKMGDAARMRAEEFYQWDGLGERLMQIYQKVLPRELTRL